MAEGNVKNPTNEEEWMDIGEALKHFNSSKGKTSYTEAEEMKNLVHSCVQKFETDNSFSTRTLKQEEWTQSELEEKPDRQSIPSTILGNYTEPFLNQVSCKKEICNEQGTNLQTNSSIAKNDLDNLVKFITPSEDRRLLNPNNIEYTVDLDISTFKPSENQIKTSTFYKNDYSENHHSVNENTILSCEFSLPCLPEKSLSSSFSEGIEPGSMLNGTLSKPPRLGNSLDSKDLKLPDDLNNNILLINPFEKQCINENNDINNMKLRKRKRKPSYRENEKFIEANNNELKSLCGDLNASTENSQRHFSDEVLAGNNVPSLQDDTIASPTKANKNSTNRNSQEMVTQTGIEIAFSEHQQLPMINYKTSVSKYVCDICQKVFISNRTLRMHNRAAHLGERYNCEICSKISNNKFEMQEHKRKSHINIEKQITNCDGQSVNLSKCSKSVSNNNNNKTKENEGRQQKNSNKTYTCGVCSKTFQSIKDCQDHCKIEHGKNIVKPLFVNKIVPKENSEEPDTTVVYCQDQAPSIREWESFKQDYMHHCEVCRDSFKERLSLHRHIVNIHINPRNGKLPLYKLQCGYCPQTFLSYKHCYTHHINFHALEQYKPKLVKIQPAEKTQATDTGSGNAGKADGASLSENTKVGVECFEQSGTSTGNQERCYMYNGVPDERQVPGQSVIETHKLTNRSSTFKERDTSGANFDDKSTYCKDNNSKDEHETSNLNDISGHCEYMIQCSVCGLACFSNRHWRNHHQQNHPDKPFHFDRYLKRRAAQNTTDNKVEESPPIFVHKGSKRCPYCKKTFVKLEPKHTEKCKKYSHHCKICGKGFHCEDDLDMHVPIHHKIEGKYIKCHICDKKFAKDEQRRKHTREKHYGMLPEKIEKPNVVKGPKKKLSAEEMKALEIVCEVCGKVLKRKHYIDIHMKIHTGEKNHQCDMCGYTCNRIENLVTHKRMHTGEKPYKCDQCGKQFTRVDNMKTHIRKVHQ